LSLNVHVPADPGERPLPVMVFFHGGGFAFGSASPPGLDGVNLARRGAVVVTVNHRLNVFGHLHLGHHHDRYLESGNAGILDLVAALEWVQHNIVGFGGDPGCVTIFGQSGGGSKVAALMAMPRARGLFHRAIIQSASSMLRFASVAEAAQNADAVLREWGVSPRGLDTLGRLSVPEMLAAVPSAIRVAGGRDHFRPVVDGTLLPGNPFDHETVHVSADVPLLIGWCDTEQRASFSLRPDMFDQTRSTAIARLAGFLDTSRDHAATVFDAYADARPRETAGDVLALVYGDYRYRHTATIAAERRIESATAPTYVYTVRWRSSALGGSLQSPHMMCLPFVFRNVDRAEAFLGSHPDRYRLQDEMSGAWVRFATTGDPNPPGSADWPGYDLASRPTMVFDRDTHVEDDPGPTERRALETCEPYLASEGEGGRRD
jgi:para-nitrobenzyl esterase